MTNTNTMPAFGLIDTPLVGLEDIQRAAFYVFFEGLNNALTEIAEYWVDRDAAFDTRVGTKFAPVTLETVPVMNFFEGHKPSLILGGPDDYPNLAVFAVQAAPTGESSQFDTMDSWFISLRVEIMVKALIDQEEIVNRRIQRMAEATVLCIRRNPALGGAVTGIDAAPSVIISDVFAVRSPGQGGGYQAQGGDGSQFVWQGAAITFRVPKDSVSPSDGTSTFASSSQIDYSQYIDQGQ